MKFVTKNGKVAALIQAEDQLSSADQVMALLEEAFERDCVGFVLPAGRVAGALPLLSNALRDRITARFGGRSPRLAIAGRVPGLIERIIRGYAKKAGLSASLLMERDTDSAVDALLSP